MKALLQQYAADYVAIQVEELEDSVNLTDTKYFNDVVREACEKLVQTRIQAELLGIDVNESSLADRLPVNDYLIRDDLFG